jgi:hypothetical protein
MDMASKIMKEIAKKSVVPLWQLELTMQQQSVLKLALRGPDNVRKRHPMKKIQQSYRACVLNAAKFGRPIHFYFCEDNKMLRGDSLSHAQINEGDSFMNLQSMKFFSTWKEVVKEYMEHTDELPHHFQTHLMHGAQILAYKHPDALIKAMWGYFYLECVDSYHLEPESEETMDNRLSDWNKEYYDQES